MTMQRRVLDLASQEARLAAMDRSAFFRALLMRAMGEFAFERGKRAPKRRALSAPKRSPEIVKTMFQVTPAQRRWLESTSVSNGGIAMSSILTMLILRWCDIDGTRDL